MLLKRHALKAGRPDRSRGLSLVEVMVALLVLAVGLAGTAGLTLFTVTGTASAQFQSQAVVFAHQMAEGIRANLAAYEAAQFATDPGASSLDCFAGTACTAEQIAQYDATQWKDRVAEELPAGLAFICTDSTPDDGQPSAVACDGAGVNVIKVFFRDSKHDDCRRDPTGGNGFVCSSDADGLFHRVVIPLVP
jgi:type IV pilus modification protein PilV